MTESYAYYRLPYADTYTAVESDTPAVELPSYRMVGRDNGFVIAPYNITDSTPLLLIPAHCVTERQLTSADGQHRKLAADGDDGETSLTPSDCYAGAFAHFHNAVAEGDYAKLVLARQKAVRLNDDADPLMLFERACRLFPRLMVMLFHTAASGTWLVASPEILVEEHHSCFHTVALAGTMPFCGGVPEWSEKNKREQRVVEEYIHDTIRPLAGDIITDGPFTMRAGNLVHLRTDFRFHISGSNASGTTEETGAEALGTVVDALHPTPAVCGLPKAEAMLFIARHEGIRRDYYSGFAGPVGINGETHLYVSLRCARLEGRTMTFFAGGGIMPESRCEEEWMETEAKIKTIAHVLQYP